jgi:hypothetical protein
MRNTVQFYFIFYNSVNPQNKGGKGPCVSGGGDSCLRITEHRQLLPQKITDKAKGESGEREVEGRGPVQKTTPENRTAR